GAIRLAYHAGMDFRLPEETRIWREELRAFLREELPPGSQGSDDYFDKEEQLPFARQFMRKLGARGRLDPAFPEEYGGMGRTVIAQFVLTEELAWPRAPAGGRLFTLGIVGPTMLIHATEEQKARWLPPISRGEHWYCQGFSEPGSGSDLASMQTSAVRDGD